MRRDPLVMTLLVRDEADIVRQNIEFHLARGVDHIIATDNGSTDGTTQILDEYQRAGCLSLIHEPSNDFQQVAWVNRMVDAAKDKFGAAWISDLPPKAPSFITRVCGFGFHILRRQFGQARRARSPQIAQALDARQRVFGCPAMNAV